jgi:hypothetical protein
VIVSGRRNFLGQVCDRQHPRTRRLKVELVCLGGMVQPTLSPKPTLSKGQQSSPRCLDPCSKKSRNGVREYNRTGHDWKNGNAKLTGVSTALIPNCIGNSEVLSWGGATCESWERERTPDGGGWGTVAADDALCEVGLSVVFNDLHGRHETRELIPQV